MAEATNYCAIAWLRFDAAHPALPGHFPGQPIVPGVLLLAQLQALLEEHWPHHALHALPAVKFLQPVLPDDTLLLGVDLQTQTTDELRGRFVLRRAAQVMAQGSWVAGMGS